MFCIYCGKELEDGSAFCKYCGKRLNSEPQQEQAVPQPASWQPAPPPEQPAYVQPPVYNPPPLPKKPGQTSGIVALAVALAMLAGSVLFTLSRFEVVDWFDGDGESESEPGEERESEEETENEAKEEDEGGGFDIGGALPSFGDSGLVGTWERFQVEYDDVMYSDEEFSRIYDGMLDSNFVFLSDEDVIYSAGTMVYEGTYKMDGDEIVLDLGASTGDLMIDGDVLIYSNAGARVFYKKQ
jgi:hypothetical protein